jgi:hypothetical protein
MAQYDVKAPDGSILTFEGPADATPEAILKAASTMYKAAEAKQKEENISTANKQPGVNTIADTLETFASKLINSVGFGIPEALDRTLGAPAMENGMPTWQSPAQRAVMQQAAAERNPGAATTGEALGYLAPAAAGAKIIGGGLKAAGSKLLNMAAPEMAAAGAASPLTSFLGASVPRAAGGVMGLQTAAATPHLIQGDIPAATGAAAVTGSNLMAPLNAIPGVGTAANTVGSVIPLGLTAIDELRRQSGGVR